ICAHPGRARQPRQRRVQFRKTVCGATGGFPIGATEESKAALVVFVNLHGRGDQHRCIEEGFHRFLPNIACSRSLRTRRIVSRTTVAFSGAPPRKTQTPCFLYIDALPRTGRKTIWSSNDSSSSDSPGSSCSCSRTGLGRTRRPARSTLSVVFMMVLYHGNYHRLCHFLGTAGKLTKSKRDEQCPSQSILPAA